MLICLTVPSEAGIVVFANSPPFPRQTGVPSVFTTQVASTPALMSLTVPRPAVLVWPKSLLPQQTGVPLVFMAHAWPPPASICLTVPSPAGMVVWPCPPSPQHIGVSSALIAQVKSSPALIDFTGTDAAALPAKTRTAVTAARVAVAANRCFDELTILPPGASSWTAGRLSRPGGAPGFRSPASHQPNPDASEAQTQPGFETT